MENMDKQKAAQATKMAPKKGGFADKVGDVVEKVGTAVGNVSPALGKKIHDVGDSLAKTHKNPNHPTDETKN